MDVRVANDDIDELMNDFSHTQYQVKKKKTISLWVTAQELERICFHNCVSYVRNICCPTVGTKVLWKPVMSTMQTVN